jgi:hypothetical protein
MKISREPAVWVGLIGSVLTSAAAINLPGLNAGQAAALVAAFSAVVIAIRTRPVAPALFTAGFSALVAVLAEYGLHLSDAWVGFLTTLILGGFTLFGIRPQVSPSTAGGQIIEGTPVTGTVVAR